MKWLQVFTHIFNTYSNGTMYWHVITLIYLYPYPWVHFSYWISHFCSKPNATFETDFNFYNSSSKKNQKLWLQYSHQLYINVILIYNQFWSKPQWFSVKQSCHNKFWSFEVKVILSHLCLLEEKFVAIAPRKCDHREPISILKLNELSIDQMDELTTIIICRVICKWKKQMFVL